MNRYGTVSSVFDDRGTVKVTFEDLEIPSEELFVFNGRTKGTKEYSMPEIGEVGMCVLIDNGSGGFYLGGGYNDETPVPSGASSGKTIKAFSDGTVIEYDENSSTLSIDANKDIKIVAKSIEITSDKLKMTIPDIEVIGSSLKMTIPDINVTGDMTVVGAIESTSVTSPTVSGASVVANGIPMETHVHRELSSDEVKIGGPE